MSVRTLYSQYFVYRPDYVCTNFEGTNFGGTNFGGTNFGGTNFAS
ncbi:pentapeptide repeat-containing protein [Streptococcus anginosus]